jgi:DNA ligase-associated metallophosphoesterase
VSAPETLDTEIAGERLLLHPQRALIWNARRTLLIADLHLGKSAVLRRAGIAAPEGSTAEDLQRLEALVARYAIERVVVLGDFVHAATDASAHHLAAFASWRAERAALQFIVVAGNHDRRAAGRELAQTVVWVAGEMLDPPFVLRHHPGASPAGYVLCGHVHPVLTLRASRRERVRAPIFWRRSDHMVLPSFGAFTGGAEVQRAAGDEAYAVIGEAVWRVPSSR